ncbi:Ger(x)C family spore germination protein [Psychrobacillus glaciei]|uniref:Ger(x)C family spore germination protein n=1 Tax=Psychrobacillus glaciei TaxID=2283160 RepID=UPI00178C67D4|nr:Ger(x)C family spore germination protein [Psychrobacillus glaciei]
MSKNISILIIVILLLSGCWDERLNKDFASIPMVGFDGEIGNLTGYFGLPGEQHQSEQFEMLSAKGISVQDVAQKVDQKVNERLDLSKLTSILLSDDTVKSDLDHYLDAYYRNSRSRLNTVLIITEGSTAPFIQYGDKMGSDVNNYYSEFVEGFKLESVLSKADIQQSLSDLKDEAIDLTLPYIIMSKEENIPELLGLALFSGKKFSGKTLNKDDSIVLQLMKKKKGKYPFLTFTHKEVPLTIRVDNLQRKMKWDGTHIEIHYKMKIGIMEYYKNHLLEKKEIQEIEKFLEETFTKQMEEILKVLHDSNCDALGIGRYARAFHPNVFEKNKWNEIYPTLTITPIVQVKVIETGIAD